MGYLRNPTLHLVYLSKKALRTQLHVDERKWLDAGHVINKLPPGNARGVSRYESLLDISKEIGLMYEQ